MGGKLLMGAAPKAHLRAALDAGLSIPTICDTVLALFLVIRFAMQSLCSCIQ